jgi:transcriptional regulator with XRE-family HTH domain
MVAPPPTLARKEQNMSATKTFQSWLVKARKKADLTYAQLSEKSGVSTGSLYGLEHGSGSPSLDTVEKICKALGTSVEGALCTQRKSEKRKSKPEPCIEFQSNNAD